MHPDIERAEHLSLTADRLRRVLEHATSLVVGDTDETTGETLVALLGLSASIAGTLASELEPKIYNGTGGIAALSTEP